MVLFNGGGGWSDRALEQLWVRRPSKQEQDLVIFPTPGEDICNCLGAERTQLPDCRLLHASLQRTPRQPAAGRRRESELRVVFAIRGLGACPTSENCSVQETEVFDLFKGLKLVFF